MSSPSHAAPFVVAVDGPAGSGKSSVSKAVAARLGFAFLDTGAAYRALTWFAVQHGIDVTDSKAVVDAIADFDYRIDTTAGDSQRVLVGETDVTAAIRDPEISARVSDVARVPDVRSRLNDVFRGILAHTDHEGIVAEGRDITTVVVPNAPARILLTADPRVRAARRAGELNGQSEADVASQLHARDRADSQVVDFMTAAPGVVTVDSTELDFEQTVDAVIDVIKAARDGTAGTDAEPSRGGTDA